MEQLPIHLPYEAVGGGPVHFIWMYPFERYRVEGSIHEAYIIKEISTFSSHYYQPNVQTRLNKVTRNDDGGEVDASDGCLSIILHPGHPSWEMNGRYFSNKEWDAARIYILLNCEEIQQFIPFNTLSHGSNKSTMNSGVCIKGRTWNDYESDYYGLVGEVIQLENSNPTKKRATLVLFKCDWFDPTTRQGSQHVYFAEYPSKNKDSIDWWVVCKIKARNQIDSPNIPYQEDDNLPPIIPNITDDLDSLRHENGELEIHEVENESDEIDREHDINAIESDEEIEESDFELSEDEGDELFCL
ncbi:hypothetical protein KY284_035733 [Solanum tuberosum]|nr:hypothetical protein KY284_035733 [Solanum tuberosum]